MVEGLIGKKIGMTQVFDKDGNILPATVIQAGPCAVIQKKSVEKDGYQAVQLGFVEDKKTKKANKPLTGHFKKSGLPPTKVVKEFRFSHKAEISEGDKFFADIFQQGEKVIIVGTSKGKGFASVIKRYGFRGGKASHGSMFHRAPGSIGASAFPSRVVKGKKMPGHMGQRRVTVKNLTVIQADRENNILVVKGAVPGPKGSYVLIKKAFFNPQEYQPEPKKEEKPKPEKREGKIMKGETEEKAEKKEKESEERKQEVKGRKKPETRKKENEE
ncbi:MAG: 50S ribosomal protein L3 [Candidatus Aminicenantales bacterium]